MERIKELQNELQEKSAVIEKLLATEKITDEDIEKAEKLNIEVTGLIQSIDKFQKLEVMKLENAERMLKVNNNNTVEQARVYAEPKVTTSKYFKDDRDASAFGEYMATSGVKNERYKERFGHEFATKTTVTTDPNNAGLLVTPPSIALTIMATAAEQGVALREVNVQRMSQLKEGINTINPEAAVMYYVGEGVAPTASTMDVRGAELIVKEVAGTILVSNRMLQSSYVNIADEILKTFSYAYARTADEAVFSNIGTVGTAQGGIVSIPQALLNLSTTLANTPAIIETGAWSTVTFAQLRALKAAVPDTAQAGAKWYMSRSAFALIFQRLMDGAGGNSGLYYQDGSRPFFDGNEVIFTDKLSLTDTNNTNTVLFGNLKNVATLGVFESFNMQLNPFIFQKEGLIEYNFRAQHDLLAYNLGVSSITAALRRVGGVSLMRRTS